MAPHSDAPRKPSRAHGASCGALRLALAAPLTHALTRSCLLRQLGYCVWSASDKAREATKAYNEVVKRREFMEAQLARSAAGRRELEKIKAKRQADKAAAGAKEGKGGNNDGEEATKPGDLATAGLQVLAGAALLA